MAGFQEKSVKRCKNLLDIQTYTCTLILFYYSIDLGLCRELTWKNISDLESRNVSSKYLPGETLSWNKSGLFVPGKWQKNIIDVKNI